MSAVVAGKLVEVAVAVVVAPLDIVGAVGFGAGPAAAIPMIMAPTEVAKAEATPDMRPATQEELMSQVRQREAERAARREREATAEAAMQQGDSFMTMQP